MMKQLPIEFFDCNTFIGFPAVRPAWGAVDAEALVTELTRAGIKRALVWHIAQKDADPLLGNEMLAQAIAPYEELFGCWALVPNQTGQLRNVEKWFIRACQNRIRAFRCWPKQHRYLLRSEVMHDILTFMMDHKIPLIYSLEFSFQNEEFEHWREIYDLMSHYPGLHIILCDMVCFGSDRFFRPLIEKYPNIYLEISSYILDGGVEAFVKDYGSQRLIFGTNFPKTYHGSTMLSLAHAPIATEDKQAIASGNLNRLLTGVQL